MLNLLMQHVLHYMKLPAEFVFPVAFDMQMAQAENSAVLCSSVVFWIFCYKQKLYFSILAVLQVDLNLKLKFYIERDNSPSIFLIEVPSKDPDSRHNPSVVFINACESCSFRGRHQGLFLCCAYTTPFSR